MFNLRWYFYGVRDVYYEIDSGRNHQIKIVRSANIIQSKSLSMDEVCRLTELVREIDFPIFPKVEEPNVGIDPLISSRLSISSEHVDIEITWTNEDALRCPSSFSTLERLCQHIEHLLEVDLSKLDPPRLM